MSVCALAFEPIYKPRLWGGERILSFFGRHTATTGPIGESWELADLEEDQSVVASGPMKGRTLRALIHAWGRDLLGRVELFGGRFPLLVKFLDAREMLSVQVHPSPRVAARLGGSVRVKDEAWYILAAEPGAVIYHGLEKGVNAAAFRVAMLSGHVEGVLRRVPVREGECYFLPSGTPHALGAGILAAEIQTPSDITYRAFDWGRVDPRSGLPRELHLEQAMECIDFDSPAPPPTQVRAHIVTPWTAVTRLVTCPAFTIELVRMVEGTEQAIPYAEPVVWIVLEGEGQVLWDRDESLRFGRGHVLLLPARLPEARARISASARWLEVTVPVPSDLAGFDRPAREPINVDRSGDGLIQLGGPAAQRPTRNDV